MEARSVDIVVISDVHLGTYGCRAKELLSYLKSIKPKTLILNGDIIDIWQFRKSYFPKSHLRVIKKIIDLASKGTEVYYITGNHDEMLRKFTDIKIGNFELCNKKILEFADGKKAWIFHGDIFDLSVLSIWGGAVDCLPVPANTVLCFVGRFWQTEKQKAQLYLVNFYKSQLDKAQSNYSRPKNPSLSSHLSFVLLTQKPFTIPTLTLDDLAHLLDVSPDELLEEIIARKYQSFEEFIHFHRIEEARVLIDSMELDSIDDVFYKVGFTSKNYFNLIFEEVTGLKSEYYIKNVVKG